MFAKILKKNLKITKNHNYPYARKLITYNYEYLINIVLEEKFHGPLIQHYFKNKCYLYLNLSTDFFQNRNINLFMFINIFHFYYSE